MPLQKYNDQGIDLYSAIFQKRNEANFAFAKAPGVISMIPGVRGSWLMSTIGATLVPDNTGLGMSLTHSGSPVPGDIGIAQMLIFDGANDYLFRVSEANILPSTKFAVGGWFQFSAPSMANATALISKWNSTPGAQNQFSLWKDANDKINLSITTTGGASTQVVTSTESVIVDQKYFLAGYYIGGTTLSLVVNKNWYTNTTSIPASIFAGTEQFTIGRFMGAGASYFSGRAALCWLSVGSNIYQPTLNAVYEQTRALFGV